MTSIAMHKIGTHEFVGWAARGISLEEAEQLISDFRSYYGGLVYGVIKPDENGPGSPSPIEKADEAGHRG